MSAPGSTRSRHGAAFATIIAVHLIVGFVLLTPGYIRPDSVAVYSWIRSVVLDRDLLFFDEWASFGMVVDGVTMFKEVSPIGALANHWWIGTSVLVAPAYLLAHGVTVLTGWWPADGFFGLYAAVLAWMSVVFGIATSLFAWVILERIGIEWRERSIALVAIWVGSPVLWYEYRFPLGTHLAGAFCVGLVTLQVLRIFADAQSDRTDFLLGLAYGLAIATRLQHVMLGPAVVFPLLVGARDWRTVIRRMLVVSAGGALPVVIQGMAWWVVYGTPFGPLTAGANLTGVTWMPFRNIALLPVLVSSYHGLFTWAPVTMLSLAGIGLALRGSERGFASCLLLMFAGEYAANSLFDRYFWGGMSFGPRRFVDLAVPFAIGLAWLLTRFRVAHVAAGIAAAWSLALTSTAMARAIDLSHDVLPSELIAAALSGVSHLPAACAALRSAVVDAAFFRASVVALCLLAVLGGVAVLLFRHGLALKIAVACMLGCVVVVAAVEPGTRRAALTDLMRFSIDRTRASRLGPLLDQQKLLRDERDYFMDRGRVDDADRTDAEIAQIQALVDSLGGFRNSR